MRSLIPWAGDSLTFKRPLEDLFRMLDDSFENLSRTKVDVYEEEGQIIVKADLPGFKKDEVKVDVKDNSLILHARREVDEKKNKKNYYRRERGEAAFREVINLPAEVDKESASAEMKNGVLEIRLPQVDNYKDAKQIEIK
ncbi:MAG: Hsp20/alpha crystallin family protein [Clostridiales bacterium]|nr:Hsp20/alpha crystallin family protein [Clostridiales bacterium]MCF8021790.1 Hsp20/alpha crystallin family protein [Clostridiales bacterium]